MMRTPRLIAALDLVLSASGLAADEPVPAAGNVALTFGVKIPMRDKVRLNATLYRARGASTVQPCVFTLTPYIGQIYHDRGMYFATHGYTFLTVDVRGRGNSEGTFRPMIQEAKDAHDAVEWLAKQPYCNGKIAMWGGSYAGYDRGCGQGTPAAPRLDRAGRLAVCRGRLPDAGEHRVQLRHPVAHLHHGRHLAHQHLRRPRALGLGLPRALRDAQLYRTLDQGAGNPSATFQGWLGNDGRRVLGQLQPDSEGLRCDRHADPEHHRPVRHDIASADKNISQTRGGGAGETFLIIGPGPRRHAHAASGFDGLKFGSAACST
jgi:hypothetical protein